MSRLSVAWRRHGGLLISGLAAIAVAGQGVVLQGAVSKRPAPVSSLEGTAERVRSVARDVGEVRRLRAEWVLPVGSENEVDSTPWALALARHREAWRSRLREVDVGLNEDGWYPRFPAAPDRPDAHFRVLNTVFGMAMKAEAERLESVAVGRPAETGRSALRDVPRDLVLIRAELVMRGTPEQAAAFWMAVTEGEARWFVTRWSCRRPAGSGANAGRDHLEWAFAGMILVGASGEAGS